MQQAASGNASSRVSVDFLLLRGLYQFLDHNVLGKGLFYKKGHKVQNWKLRSYVINNFSADREDWSQKDGHFRYFNPHWGQGSDYNRDTSRDYIRNMMGLQQDQKNMKLHKVTFSIGSPENVKNCGTVYPHTAFPLNVRFEDESGNIEDFEFVFDNKQHTEDFIGSVVQAAKLTPGVEVST